MSRTLKTKPTASVIIVVKNDRGIEATLAIVSKQAIAPEYEIIVVDASADGSLSDIKARYPQVRWEQFDQRGRRFTITAQRNLGIKLARADVIVFLDANCEPQPGWLEALTGTIADGEDIVTGPCRPSNAKNLVHYIEEHTERTYVLECTTINVALRRDVISRTGLFDETLDYGEDVDFFWRASDCGYKICFEPAAAMTHDYGDAGEQRSRAYRYGKSRAIIHAKHWQRRRYQLLRYEPHVWIYPLFILSLPLAILWPPYILLLLIPIIKNRSTSVIVHHLIYGSGVLVGAVLSVGMAFRRRLEVAK